MKSEKGMTLISVTIYVIAMLIIVTIITILTSYFYKNIDINSVSDDLNQQYTRFNSYFTEEVNKKGNFITAIGEIEIEDVEDESRSINQKYIVFSSGNQYTYIPDNDGIYMNNIKIANNITECNFEKKEEDGKTKITVQIKGENFDRTTTYTLVE